MDHYRLESKQTNGVAIINLVLILAFIVLIVAGYTLSIDRNSGEENNWSTKKMLVFLGWPFQSQSKPQLILPKKKSAALMSARLSDHEKEDADRIYQVTMNNKKKAMLGMFFVMLKKG